MKLKKKIYKIEVVHRTENEGYIHIWVMDYKFKIGKYLFGNRSKWDTKLEFNENSNIELIKDLSQFLWQ